MKARVLLLASLALLGSCSRAPKPDYTMNVSMKELMKNLIDPGSFQIWNSSGEDTTASGTTSRTPTTDQGWANIKNGAVEVIEAGNLMMMPGRTYGAEWNAFAKQMSTQALAVKTAADAKDGQRVFDTGGKLYETCTACHEKYYLPYVGANKAVPPPPKP